MATKSPASNSNSRSSGSSGASFIETERVNISSSGGIHGSSSAFPSYDICKRLASVEYGGSPCLSLGIARPLLFAHSTNFILELKSHSLHGEIILISGCNAEYVNSNLI